MPLPASVAWPVNRTDLNALHQKIAILEMDVQNLQSQVEILGKQVAQWVMEKKVREANDHDAV